MASKDSKRIMKLGNDNYYAWSYHMEMCLRKLQVWSLVEGTESHPQGSDGSKAVKAWRIRTDLVLSEIVSEIKDGQLVHMRVSRDLAEVWAKLESIHLSQGLGSAISTWQKLFHITKAPNTSIQEHAGAICELADHLTGLDDTPSNSLLVATLMLSLLESYSSLIISLDSHSSKNDFDFVVQRCMNKEARQVATAMMQGVPAGKVDKARDLENIAFHTRIQCDQKDITCFGCGQKGHYQNECKVAEKPAGDAPKVAAAAYTSKVAAVW